MEESKAEAESDHCDMVWRIRQEVAVANVYNHVGMQASIGYGRIVIVRSVLFLLSVPNSFI